MAYPDDIESLRTDLGAGESMQTADHAGVHNAVDRVVNALQTELGINPSGAYVTVAALLAGLRDGTALNTGAVSTGKLADDAVTAAKIAADAVGASEIAAGAVGTSELADGSVTGDKIADGTITNADVSATAAIAATKLAGVIPVSLIDAKADLIVGTANDTAARFGVGTDGQILAADSSQVSGLTWAYPTNLLRNNVATAGDTLGTTTGFPATTADGKHSQITYSIVDKVADPTYAACITQGSKALKMFKASGGGTGAFAGVPLSAAGIGSNAINGGTYPVTPGDVITFAFDVSSITHTDLFRAAIRFYATSGSGGTLISEVASAAIALTSTPVRHYVAAKVPSGAAFAAFWARTNSAISTAATCEVVFDRFQLNAGIGARWAMSPMQLADDGTIWTDRSPEGWITAPLGAIAVDENATTGAVTWIKQSASGSTGWRVVAADTGIRNLSAETLSSSWAVNGGTFELRRDGDMVTINALLDKTSATADAVYTLPAGFRPAVQHRDVCNTTTADDFAPVAISTAGVISITRSAMTGSVAQLSTTFVAAAAWPTTLPGT